jgi:hypothetical protein
MAAARQPYPFTTTNSALSNNPYRRQNTMNQPRTQQQQQQQGPYPLQTPPGSTTALLHPQSQAPQAGPSRSNVQAAFSRGPTSKSPSNTYQDVSASQTHQLSFSMLIPLITQSRFAQSSQSLLSNVSGSAVEKVSLLSVPCQRHSHAPTLFSSTSLPTLLTF